MSNTPIIIGAGLAGLIAGVQFPTSKIIEIAPSPSPLHRSLLRFRSNAVSIATNIEFTPVTVHKGIYSGTKFVQPNIRLANMYSKKVINQISDRSIWNIDPCVRYIAPESFYEQLIERVGHRIEWGAALTSDMIGTAPIISTIPMPLLYALLSEIDSEIPVPPIPFNYSPILVSRFRIYGCNTYQTVYYPAPAVPYYRASITKDLLIAESIRGAPLCGFNKPPQYQRSYLYHAFCIDVAQCEPIEIEYEQRFGKIAPIDNEWRRAFMHGASVRHNVYSLGRFATWRNILLDDVLHDIEIIKKLIREDGYGARRINSGQ
jgi:hypothetical protein